MINAASVMGVELMERELGQQNKLLCENKVQLDEKLKYFDEVVQLKVKYNAYMELLSHVQSKKFIKPERKANE